MDKKIENGLGISSHCLSQDAYCHENTEKLVEGIILSKEINHHLSLVILCSYNGPVVTWLETMIEHIGKCFLSSRAIQLLTFLNACWYQILTLNIQYGTIP